LKAGGEWLAAALDWAAMMAGIWADKLRLLVQIVIRKKSVASH